MSYAHIIGNWIKEGFLRYLSDDELTIGLMRFVDTDDEFWARRQVTAVRENPDIWGLRVFFWIRFGYKHKKEESEEPKPKASRGPSRDQTRSFIRKKKD